MAEFDRTKVRCSRCNRSLEPGEDIETWMVAPPGSGGVVIWCPTCKPTLPRRPV